MTHTNIIPVVVGQLTLIKDMLDAASEALMYGWAYRNE